MYGKDVFTEPKPQYGKRLWEFQLPEATNAGDPYVLSLHEWEDTALGHAGGYTRLPAGDGFWRDGQVTYQDRMVLYRVLCDRDTMQTLLDAAFRLFPDQTAIFVADIGTATIHYRSK